MKIFIICPVRNAGPEIYKRMVKYVEAMEAIGHTVHFPPRDTDQTASEVSICRQNYKAILESDEVHIFYTPDSQGTHFDMGVAFALNKTIRVDYVPKLEPGKSFPKMLLEWEASQDW